MDTGNDLLTCIGWFLSNSWKFFTRLEVPGLGGVTFAALFVGLFLIVFSVRLLGYIFGFGSVSSGEIKSVGGRLSGTKDSSSKGDKK